MRTVIFTALIASSLLCAQQPSTSPDALYSQKGTDFTVEDPVVEPGSWREREGTYAMRFVSGVTVR